MTATDELRRLWAGWHGETAKKTKATTVAFPGEGRTWNLPVADITGEAFRALAGLMSDHGYLFREVAGGTWNIRNIKKSGKPSLHSYGIAIDLNPSKNAFGQCGTDIPAAFRADVLALRTSNGKPVFSWGGDWRPCHKADPMHFQINCSPADITTGIVTADITTGIVNQGGIVSHPARSYNEFVKDHDTGSIPDWSPWDEYVAAGGSTAPESGTRPMSRADIAWFWKRFVEPLRIEVETLKKQGGGDSSRGAGRQP